MADRFRRHLSGWRIAALLPAAALLAAAAVLTGGYNYQAPAAAQVALGLREGLGNPAVPDPANDASGDSGFINGVHYPSDRLIIRYKETRLEEQISEDLTGLGFNIFNVVVTGGVPSRNTFFVRFSGNADPLKVSFALNEFENVEYAQPDYYLYGGSPPTTIFEEEEEPQPSTPAPDAAHDAALEQDDAAPPEQVATLGEGLTNPAAPTEEQVPPDEPGSEPAETVPDPANDASAGSGLINGVHYPSDRLNIRYKETRLEEQISEDLMGLGFNISNVVVTGGIASRNTYFVKFSGNADPLEVSSALSEFDNVVWAEPDYFQVLSGGLHSLVVGPILTEEEPQPSTPAPDAMDDAALEQDDRPPREYDQDPESLPHIELILPDFDTPTTPTVEPVAEIRPDAPDAVEANESAWSTAQFAIIAAAVAAAAIIVAAALVLLLRRRRAVS